MIVHDPQAIDWTAPGKRHYRLAFHLDSTWGYVLVPLTVIVGERGPGRTVAVFGGTHGNEYEGQVAAWRLTLELEPAALAGRVLLMPRLCTPACDAGTRECPLDGVNMNRAFPGDPRGTITYRIADFVTGCVLSRADVVLDLHSGGRTLRFPMVASFHEVPDPTQQREMAEAALLFDTPMVMIYSRAMARGLLTDQSEAMGKITLGTELGWGEAVIPQGVRHATIGTRNILKRYGLLEGEPERIRPPEAPPTRFVRAVRLEDYLPAPVRGVYEPIAEPGDRVAAGELLGRLYRFEEPGAPPIELRAPREGWLLTAPFAAAVEQGQTVAVIGDEETMLPGGTRVDRAPSNNPGDPPA